MTRLLAQPQATDGRLIGEDQSCRRERLLGNCRSERVRVKGPIQSAAETETTMRSLLLLLVALTMTCGAAASVTIALAPAYADDAGKGY
jgi:hypothetical protein